MQPLEARAQRQERQAVQHCRSSPAGVVLCSQLCPQGGNLNNITAKASWGASMDPRHAGLALWGELHDLPGVAHHNARYLLTDGVLGARVQGHTDDENHERNAQSAGVLWATCTSAMTRRKHEWGKEQGVHLPHDRGAARFGEISCRSPCLGLKEVGHGGEGGTFRAGIQGRALLSIGIYDAQPGQRLAPWDPGAPHRLLRHATPQHDTTDVCRVLYFDTGQDDEDSHDHPEGMLAIVHQTVGTGGRPGGRWNSMPGRQTNQRQAADAWRRRAARLCRRTYRGGRHI
ncbi:hypothetical protein Micbo1qcDRAFT_172408 [Microdochium bolleyi]|uniref:Uncharacterized protein n=1 Tax=Microdochium bolleyi TaxID=196109 RepID=A0A136JG43_9PEZI|nr:hypothetical protein Micbo1qcDRAFT_172408 [Microdochium bolleyi]